MADPTVTACMIVRDGAATLERALASVRPLVDEVCIYLGGESTDGTPALLDELAAQPGAPIVVEQGEWRGDFSWAREQSFAMATSDWLLWLDDDEIVHADGSLRDVLVGDFVYMRKLDFLDGDDELARSWNIRAVRRPGGVRWRGVIHEVLEPPAGAAGTVAPPSEVWLEERRTFDGRSHQYRVDAQYAAGDTRLVNFVAGSIADSGDPAAACALLERWIAAHVTSPASQYDHVYLTALAGLAVYRQRRDDRAGTAAALRLRDSILARWRQDVAAGRCTGHRALWPEMERYDDEDGIPAGWEPMLLPRAQVDA